MQQVGAKGFASAQAIHPRRLPVAARLLPARALIGFGHIWVLHRRLLLRAAAAGIVLVSIVGIYELRDQIGGAALTIADLAQGEFARAGFGISRIDISGQSLTRETDIVDALGLGPKISTLNFDADAARARILKLPAIKSVTIRKVYPLGLSVAVEEKVPAARWRVNGVTYVVDLEGSQIAEDNGEFAALPLVVGDGAADHALAMIRTLDRHPMLRADLAAISRIGDRRWDLIYNSGLRVQLPELGVAQALAQLEAYQRDYALLDRDVSLIDLRVPGMVALKPGDLAVAKIIADEKAAAAAHQTAGSSEYETPAERQAEPGPIKP